MIAHVVLFKPRADLAGSDRAQLYATIHAAHRDIPGIQRFVIGSRIKTGFPYDQVSRDFPFCALLEFDTRAQLDAYLSHPAHVELGSLFYVTSEAAEAYDFALRDVGGLTGPEELRDDLA